MNKIKEFFKVKSHIAIFSICFLSVITVASVAIFMITKKPPANDVIPTVKNSEPTSSETVSQKEVVVQPIVVDKETSSFSSSAVLAKSEEKPITLKVDGNTSSKPTKKATSSKPQAKTTEKIATKPQIEVTENKPTPTEPTSPLPTSSEPTEPIEIPYNPDGPQHGDTDIGYYTGQTVYYHVGIGAYIDELFWKDYKFGKHPEASDNMYTSNETMYLNDGDIVSTEGIWCGKCKVFVIDKTLKVHDNVLHKK